MKSLNSMFSGCNRVSSWWCEVLERWLMRLGTFCGTRPYFTIVTSLLVCFGLAGCFVLTEFDDDIRRSWSDPGSRVHGESDYFEERFLSVGDGLWMFVSKNSGDEVLTDAAMADFLDLRTKLLEDFEFEYDGETVTYPDICFRDDTGECMLESVLTFWGNDIDAFLAANVSTRHATLQDDPLGTNIAIESIAGGVEYDSNGRISKVAATTVQLSYIQTEVTDAMDLELPGFYDDWSKEQDRAVDLYFVTQNFDSEINRTIGVAMGPLMIGMVLMVLFMTFKLSKKNFLHSQTVLGLCGVVEVVVSLAAGLGLSAVFGVPFSGITPIVAFVILGVGVDDVFILWDASTCCDPDLPVPIQMADTLRRGGSSVTMTSFTSFAAFAFGATTRVQAVRWFCLNAAIIILVDYGMQITFFVACLALDARRRQNQKYDCLCCFGPRGRVIPSASAPATPRNPALERTAQQGNGSAPQMRRNWSVTALYNVERDYLRVFINRYYAPWLVKKPVKIGIMTSAVVLFCVCAYGASMVALGQTDADVLPNDSYILDFQEQRLKYFDGARTEVLYVYRDGVDYEDPKTLELSRDLIKEVEKIDAIRDGEATFWLFAYEAFRDGIPEPDENFYHYICLPETDPLAFFAVEQFAPFRDTMLLAESGPCEVISSFLVVPSFEPRDGAIQAKFYDDLAAVADNSELDVFAIHEEFPFWDLYGLFVTETVLTLIVGGAAVFVVLVFFMAPTAATIVIATIAVIDVEIIGLMALSDTKLNPVTFTALIGSVGLSVDYVSHVAHGFLTYRGAPDLRAVHAVREIGVSVLNGATSTFIGIVMMSTVPAQAFTIFFKMFAFVVVLGIFHGLAVIPVLLSYLNPSHVGTDKTGIDGSMADVPPDVVSSRSMPPLWQDGRNGGESGSESK